MHTGGWKENCIDSRIGITTVGIATIGIATSAVEAMQSERYLEAGS